MTGGNGGGVAGCDDIPAGAGGEAAGVVGGEIFNGESISGEISSGLTSAGRTGCDSADFNRSSSRCVCMRKRSNSTRNDSNRSFSLSSSSRSRSVMGHANDGRLSHWQVQRKVSTAQGRINRSAARIAPSCGSRKRRIGKVSRICRTLRRGEATSQPYFSIIERGIRA